MIIKLIFATGLFLSMASGAIAAPLGYHPYSNRSDMGSGVFVLVADGYGQTVRGGPKPPAPRTRGAPAPLLGAGWPALAAIGGGVGGYALWWRRQRLKKR